MGFQNLPPELRKEYATRGGQANQTPQLREAKLKADKLREEFIERKESVTKIAARYGIGVRAVYRIVNHK